MKSKYSGYEWFGNIPETWDMLPIRAIYDERRDKNTNNEVTQVLSLLKDIGIVPYEEKGDIGNKMTDTPENHKVVEPGDLVVNKMNAVIGSLGISRYKGTVSQVYFVLRLQNNNCNNEYLEYIFKYRGFQRSLKRISKGIMEIRESIDWNDFKNLGIPIPPKTEQDEIVQYIKAQEEKINLFIQKKQRFIELLKEQRQRIITYAATKGTNEKVNLKQTGIQGLNEIPEHWEVRRLKNVSKTISKGTTPSTIGSETTEEGTIRFLRAENLYENKITLTPTFYIDQETDQILFRSRLETNDVLLVIAGATLGRTGIVTEEILPANTNQAVCFIRPDNIYPEFLLLWMQTNFISAEIWLNATQAAQPNLAMGKIATFYILYPPIEEQKQIVEYIKTETATIDTAIAKAEREIELIREYKEAMIAEAVMGKRRNSNFEKI